MGKKQDKTIQLVVKTHETAKPVEEKHFNMLKQDYPDWLDYIIGATDEKPRPQHG